MSGGERPILLVEDNPDDVDLTLRAFKRAGVSRRVDVVTDGVEALDYLFCRAGHAARAGQPPPAVVLLDLKLPRLDGHEVLRHIRADPRTRLLPVVILSSSVEEEDVVRGYGGGANSYVRKPVSYTEFVEAARQLGLYWLALDHGAPVEPFPGARG
ncbi:response regulator [Corallococcus macrosporus]|uniref:Two-component system response regulator n=2 Tax=Myxococcaceae TaxID=31 RepID=A0A250JLH2_9BACT|nr:response regulator [Corallococcus macrosporus]AEI63388.1 response regulator receiver protein [Corallococcus macrosporus]ATB44715.1 two-component system response regulator [Corallococcus macrosporus DSM 14697]